MSNYKKKQILDLIKIFGLGVLFVILTLTGCSQSYRVSENISQEANNFNVVRRITVINARTDTVLLQLTGTFSLRNNSDNELEVICELEDGKYQKHYVYLNEYTLYVVEDLSGSNVSKYSYELNFLPEMIPGVKITSKD
nr:MAG TPA: Lysis protein [Caudoviricetes sp.]